MIRIFTHSEKLAIADHIEDSFVVAGSVQRLGYSDLCGVIGYEWDTEVVGIINGMLDVLGYHETIRTLRGSTMTDESVELHAQLETLIDDGEFAKARLVVAQLDALPNSDFDMSLSEAKGLLDRLRDLGHTG